MRNLSVLTICIIFLVSILLFAVIYFLMFRINTANFYISDEFNERVNARYIEREQGTLYDIPDWSVIPFSIDEFNQRIKPVNDTLQQTYHIIDNLVISRDELESKSENLYFVFAKSREMDIEQYRENSLRCLLDSVKRQEEEIAACLARGVTEEQLILNGCYVNLASMKYKYASKSLQVSDYVLKNYGSFGDRLMLDSLNVVNRKILDAGNEIWKLEDKKREYFNLYEDMTRAFHRQRIEKVSFTDFLYFSLLIATSNSFGDIVPNSSIARTLVSIQLLIGIICVGLILNKIPLN